MKFKNYEVTPLGNAKLSINGNGNLVVENLDNSGLNGVMIHNNGNKGIHIEYNPL